MRHLVICFAFNDLLTESNPKEVETDTGATQPGSVSLRIRTYALRRTVARCEIKKQQIKEVVCIDETVRLFSNPKPNLISRREEHEN